MQTMSKPTTGVSFTPWDRSPAEARAERASSAIDHRHTPSRRRFGRPIALDQLPKFRRGMEVDSTVAPSIVDLFRQDRYGK